MYVMFCFAKCALLWRALYVEKKLKNRPVNDSAPYSLERPIVRTTECDDQVQRGLLTLCSVA